MQVDKFWWLIYMAVVLAISGGVGWHLRRFREAYTEMTGMMAGMTMGMMNGFVLGYAAAAAMTQNHLFWGNLIGVLLGLGMGAWFGRAGGLLGIMDGAMGGVMGGAMGAMLAAMLLFPREVLVWTAVLLSVIYVVSMAGLIVLIERSAPQHAALHRFMPMFARAMAAEAAEEAQRARGRRGTLVDYYVLLGVEPGASEDEVAEGYLARLASADGEDVELLERAMATLSDPVRRRVYDQRLIAMNGAAGRADCCPPPKKARVTSAPAVATALPNRAGGGGRTATATAPVASRQAAMPVRERAAVSRQGKQVASAKVQGSGKQHANVARKKAKQQRREAPISGVGIVVGLLLIVLLAWWVMSQGVAGRAATNAELPPGGHISAPQSIPPELEAQAVVAPVGADGRQTLDFVVNGDTWGYEPNVIKVKQGVPVHFNVSTKGQDPG